MSLREVRLQLPAAQVDAWSDALLEAGAVSVCIEDSDSNTAAESPLYGEPGMEPAEPAWPNNQLSVLVDAAYDVDELLLHVATALGGVLPAVLSREILADRDWVQQTQAQFEPVRIGTIWIVPSWHEPPDPAACVVRIDPGVAFGTGTHPTTRLCVAWLDRHCTPGSSVLDYGCGSGILSICAAMRGATTVVGVDIDPQALLAARSNAAANGVVAQYTDGDALAAQGSGQFDIVVANILANPIVLLAPTLARHVRPGGTLLLSGILERQAADVVAAYEKADPGLHLAVEASDEGWVAIVGTRAVPVPDGR